MERLRTMPSARNAVCVKNIKYFNTWNEKWYLNLANADHVRSEGTPVRGVVTCALLDVIPCRQTATSIQYFQLVVRRIFFDHLRPSFGWMYVERVVLDRSTQQDPRIPISSPQFDDVSPVVLYNTAHPDCISKLWCILTSVDGDQQAVNHGICHFV